MKSALLVIPFLLVGLVPVAFGQVVETAGQNYDLIEDYNIGEAKWTSHPERIMVNGEWENYFLQANDQQIIFRSNSVGGFIYDIPSCSYSIYENGFDGNQIIPSVSSVASYNVNGNWQNMAVNQEECLVNLSQGDNGIFITSTKTLFGEINQPIFQSYNGTDSTVNVNGTSYNVISNGNQTGYYVDNFVNVETEKFVQELKVDIFGGIKETFKVWNESDEPLGISQTVHTGESITIGENTLNIAELNGQSFSKQFLEDNEAQVFEIAESLNYDFKDGFDSLSNVNIFFDGDYKVNLDYASGDFVNYLEIDPTFTSPQTNNHYAIQTSGGASSSCGTAVSKSLATYRYSYLRPTTASNADSCYISGYQVDTSSIPDSSIITNVELTFDSQTIPGWGNPSGKECAVYDVTTDLSGTVSSAMLTDIMTGTNYIGTGDTSCHSGITTYDLGTQADTDLQNNLSNDFFAMGLGWTDFTRNSNNVATGDIRNLSLSITYSLPTAPQPPTNLQTVTGIPIELDWTAPVDDGGSSITGYKVYRTLNQYVMTELPNNGGTTPVDFTDNELLLHAESISSTTPDSSPNTLTVTANSGTTTIGAISNAISTPNLEVTSSLLPDGTDSFTVGSWVKQTATPTNTKLFGFTNSNGDNVAFNVGTTTADFKVNTTPIISATGLTDNTSDFQHYALTRDGSSWTLYQNGASVATATDSTDLGSRSSTSRNSSLDGTKAGSSVSASTGKVGTYAGDFSGTGTVDFTAKHNLHQNSQYSIAFWLNVDTYVNNGIIFDDTDFSSANIGIGCRTENTNQVFCAEMLGSVGSNYWGLMSTTGASTGTWYHYVITVDGGNVATMYRNGQSVVTDTSFGTKNTNPSTYNFRMGDGANGNDNNYDGKIDQLVMYDRILSGTEISNLFNSGSGTTTVPTNGLVAHWDFEQTGSTLENQAVVTTQNPHTINIDGSIDEYFIDSTALSSNEVETVYGMGSQPTQIATTGTTPEYDDSGVTGGNTYYYYVKSTNAIGDSDFSTQASGLAGTPPDAPTGLSASIQNTDTAPRDVFLQWSAPTNVGSGTLTGFEIWRDGSLVTTVGLVSSYVDIVPTVGTYTYTVKAVATHGTSVDSNSAQITTPNLPDAPQGLTLSIDNPNPSPLTVTVTVSPPLNDGGSAVTGYNIYTSTDDITYTLQASNVGNPSNITVPSAGVWFFKAEAVNGVGAGALSSNAIIGTPNVPDAPSLSLAINDPNANPLTITTTFTEGATNGGSAVTGFNLYSSPDDINYNLVAGDISSPYSTTVSNAGTWYFKAEAVNNVGNSLASISYSIATPTVPNAPASVSTSIPDIDNAPSSVVITWTAPTNNGGSILTGYKVYRDTSLITTVGAGIFTFTDTDVKTVNTQYTYEVRATNNVGEGLGTTSNITTPNTPLAPTLSIFSGTTKLTWTTPTSDGTITGYKIYRDSSLIKTTGLVLTYTDMSVLNWSNSYNYQISAVSTIGEGALSNTVIGQNFDTNVDDATAFGTTGTSSIIDWTEPPYFQGNVTSYSVYYSTPYSSNPSTLIGTTGNTYLNLYNQLQYDTNYAFMVLVNSPLGNTSVGNVVNATTTENLGIVTYDPTTGANWFDIDAVNQEDLSTTKYTRVDNGDTVLLEIEYPTNYEDMTCDVGFKFGQQTLQYVEGEDMTATALDAEHQAVVMQFNNQGNEVITVECADQNVPNSASSYTVTTTFGNFPLLTQIADFRTGEYGTNGMFGALDLITLFVVIISMVGFNRINPIAGVIMGVSAISGLAYFGVINLPPAIIGIFALLAFLAWGVTRK